MKIEDQELLCLLLHPDKKDMLSSELYSYDCYCSFHFISFCRFFVKLQLFSFFGDLIATNSFSLDTKLVANFGLLFNTL